MPNNKGRRGANGAGTIRHRADGSWEGIMTIGIDPGTGKPKKKSVYAKTQKEVRQKMTELRDKLDKQIYADDRNLTVAQWAKIWLEQFCVNMKPNTLQNYVSCVNTHLVPSVGAIKLRDLKPLHIQRLLNGIAHDGGANTTVCLYYRIMHVCFQKAVDLQYIYRNPCDKVTHPSYTTSEIKPLPRQVIRDFIKLADETPYGDMFVICLCTGMRIGETGGLSWDNIDFDNSVITVSQQVQYSNKFKIGTTKSGRTRTIVPADIVFERLAKIKAKQERQSIGKPSSYNQKRLVFVNSLGKPIGYNSIRTAYKDVVTKLGYPKARLHDLRHTYATLSLELGDNLKTVSESLGHSTIAITGNVYAHVTQHTKRESANRFQAMIDSTKDE